jgi:uncharacterized membrane protein (DUF4010 family)
VTFGAVYGLVLLGVSWLSEVAGAGGLYAFAFVSGLTDVDAIALSTMRAHVDGRLEPGVAVTVIGIALVANLILKAVTAWIVGGRALADRLILPFGAIVVAIIAARFVVVGA